MGTLNSRRSFALPAGVFSLQELCSAEYTCTALRAAGKNENQICKFSFSYLKMDSVS